MSEPILAVVEDLFFLSRVQHTAQQVGVAVEPVEISRIKERLLSSPVRAVILDLNYRSGDAVEATRAIKADPATAQVQVVGFLSHVQGELARNARLTGCDQVLARSAFTRELPQLLLQLAGRSTG